MITKDSLLALEAVTQIRETAKADLIAHRKLHTVHLGKHVKGEFESERTIRRHIQQMRHIEMTFVEVVIEREIEACQSLVPDGKKLEVDDADRAARRARAAARFGVAGGRARPDVPRGRRPCARRRDRRCGLAHENDAISSVVRSVHSVHSVRIEHPNAVRDAVHAGASVKLGRDHTHCPAHAVFAPEAPACLAGDWR